MNLSKRYRRNIRHNLSFYISAVLLTAISVYLLVAMYTGIGMMEKGFSRLMKIGNVEDAEFTTLLPIDEDGISYIENTYNTDFEKIEYVDMDEGDYSLRIFAPAEKVNIYEVLDGRDITGDEQILLNPDFAGAHDISVGDSFIIEGGKYIVAGLCVRPDYIYAQKDVTDFYVNNKTFGQVTMSRSAFDRLDHRQSYYSIVYHQDNDKEVRQYLYDEYTSLRYLSADANSRISQTREAASQIKVVTAFIVPVLF